MLECDATSQTGGPSPYRRLVIADTLSSLLPCRLRSVMRALEGVKRLGFDVPFWGMSLVRIRLVISPPGVKDQGREADTEQKQGVALGAQDSAKKSPRESSAHALGKVGELAYGIEART